MSRPCAAADGGGSFLDHAVSPGLNRGAFSSVGSFRAGVVQAADFGALHAAPGPERQTGAMLLASLGLLVLIARRRSRALSAAD